MAYFSEKRQSMERALEGAPVTTLQKESINETDFAFSGNDNDSHGRSPSISSVAKRERRHSGTRTPSFEEARQTNATTSGPSIQVVNRAGDGRPPSLSSVHSAHRGRERRNSGTRPPSFEEARQTHINATGGPPTQGFNGVGDGRTASVSSVQGTHRGKERRYSGTRISSFEEGRPNIPGGQPPPQDVNEPLRDPNSIPKDKDDTLAGTWAVHHHKGNLIEKRKVHTSRFVRMIRRITTLGPSKTESEPRESAQPKKSWHKLRSTSKPDTSQIEVKTEETDDEEIEGNIQVSFAELQRMRLRKLQIKLVRQAIQMHYSPTDEEPNGWEETLQQYIQAMRDYDYMNDCVQRSRDPFIVSTTRLIDYRVLRDALYDAAQESSFAFAAPLETQPEPIGGTRTRSFEKARLQKFAKHVVLASLLGSGFLIGPMWLLVLHNTHYTALISTSVCVVVFAAFMAWVLDDLISVLSVTSAYAAVLVVFVGTNTVN